MSHSRGSSRGVARPPNSPPSAAAIREQELAEQRRQEAEQEEQVLYVAGSGEAPAPHTVCIVSFGYEQKSGKDWLAIADGLGFLVHDVRHRLPKDPAAAVGHKEDGLYPQTVNTVVGQHGFPALLMELLSSTMEHSFVSVGCRQGVHRADVTCRFLESIVNMAVDDNGNRLCNAKYFALSSAYGLKGTQKMIRDIQDWCSDPWVVTEGGPLPLKERYGYEASHRSRESSMNFKAIQTQVATMYRIDPIEVSADVSLEPASAPAKVPSAGYVASEFARGSHDAAAPSRPSSASSARVPLPLPPAMRPKAGGNKIRPTRASILQGPSASSGSAGPDVSQVGAAHPGHGFGEDQHYEESSGLHADAGEEEIGSQVGSSAAGSEGQKRQRGYEAWETAERNVMVWADVLRNAGCDETSRQELFLLAQHSDDGFKEANSIIGKILKKRSDKEVVANMSGFVHSCVRNARNEIGSWRFSGDSSSGAKKSRSGGRGRR